MLLKSPDVMPGAQPTTSESASLNILPKLSNRLPKLSKLPLQQGLEPNTSTAQMYAHGYIYIDKTVGFHNESTNKQIATNDPKSCQRFFLIRKQMFCYRFCVMKYACVPKVRARILSKSAATKSLFVFFPLRRFIWKQQIFTTLWIILLRLS